MESFMNEDPNAATVTAATSGRSTRMRTDVLHAQPMQSIHRMVSEAVTDLITTGRPSAKDDALQALDLLDSAPSFAKKQQNGSIMSLLNIKKEMSEEVITHASSEFLALFPELSGMVSFHSIAVKSMGMALRAANLVLEYHLLKPFTILFCDLLSERNLSFVSTIEQKVEVARICHGQAQKICGKQPQDTLLQGNSTSIAHSVLRNVFMDSASWLQELQNLMENSQKSLSTYLGTSVVDDDLHKVLHSFSNRYDVASIKLLTTRVLHFAVERTSENEREFIKFIEARREQCEKLAKSYGSLADQAQEQEEDGNDGNGAENNDIAVEFSDAHVPHNGAQEGKNEDEAVAQAGGADAPVDTVMKDAQEPVGGDLPADTEQTDPAKTHSDAVDKIAK